VGVKLPQRLYGIAPERFLLQKTGDFSIHSETMTVPPLAGGIRISIFRMIEIFYFRSRRP
jgi:hypothetical protein